MKGYSEWLKEQSYLRKALGEGFNPITEGYNVDYDNVFKIIGRLEEPTKVVVPKFVADWYKESKDELEFDIFNLVVIIDEKDYDELTEIEAWFNNIGNEPIETIIRMKLFGYEIEKEKLYRVEVPGTDNLLLTLEGSEYYFDEQIDYIGDKPNIRQEFTEKEIKAIDERYWMFKKEVA